VGRKLKTSLGFADTFATIVGKNSQGLQYVMPPNFVSSGAISRDAGKPRIGGVLPELHSIHKVKILNAFHDGIFVKIPGYTHDGLIHHSQISRNLTLALDMPKADRYRKINELVGDIEYQVYAKVVYVCDEPDHTKCECSLKMVRTLKETKGSLFNDDGMTHISGALVAADRVQLQLSDLVLWLPPKSNCIGLSGRHWRHH
jgi:predicted RNA-binding protein with RPS1 domain